MNMKKLMLGALLVVSASAFGVQTEVGTFDDTTYTGAKVSGAAELNLESFGAVRSIGKGTVILVLESKANNFNDRNKLTFGFDTINVGSIGEADAQFGARLYVGNGAPNTGVDIADMLPVTFVDPKTAVEVPTTVKVQLIDEAGVTQEHSSTKAAKFDVPVVNEKNNVVGALVYEVQKVSLGDGNKEVNGTIKAKVYTKGSNLPQDLTTDYGDSSSNVEKKITEATGNFRSTAGKFRFVLQDLDISHDANLKKVFAE